MEEKELFQDYELKSWELSPRIYKILGIAAALHLFGLIVFSQVDLLGTKACDSPYVGKVCQVLDAAYVSSILLGTDMEFSSRDYDKTEIDEADVTWVDVGSQFTYPPGYFELSNPAPAYDPTMVMTDPNGMQFPSTTNGFPGFNSSPSTLDPNGAQVLPTPNPNPIQGDIPGITTNIPTTPRPSRTTKFPTYRPKNNSPSRLPKLNEPNSNQTANKDKNSNSNTNANQEDKTKPETPKKDDEKLFNKKPLEDFAAKHGKAILENEVDINAPFTIEVIAKLSENGKLVNPKMVSTADSDPKMTELAKEAIGAFGDSQLLLTLYKAVTQNDPKPVPPTLQIKFQQTADNLQAIIQVETKSENRAKQIQSGLKLLLQLANLKEGSPEELLLKKAELATNGKIFVINFLIPNDEKTALIRKELEKEKEKEKVQQNKPNGGVAETANKDINSAK